MAIDGNGSSRDNNQAQTIVATFTNIDAARDALGDLGGKDKGVQRGSVLLRDQSGSVYVRELDERSLGEITRSGIDLGTFVIAGGLGILVEAAFSSINLLLRSTGRAADLAGTILKAPVRRVRDIFLSDPDVKGIGESLAPGASALVVDVDADKSAAVAARLIARGGTVDLTTH